MRKANKIIIIITSLCAMLFTTAYADGAAQDPYASILATISLLLAKIPQTIEAAVLSFNDGVYQVDRNLTTVILRQQANRVIIQNTIDNTHLATAHAITAALTPQATQTQKDNSAASQIYLLDGSDSPSSKGTPAPPPLLGGGDPNDTANSGSNTYFNFNTLFSPKAYNDQPLTITFNKDAITQDQSNPAGKTQTTINLATICITDLHGTLIDNDGHQQCIFSQQGAANTFLKILLQGYPLASTSGSSGGSSQQSNSTENKIAMARSYIAAKSIIISNFNYLMAERAPVSTKSIPSNQLPALVTLCTKMQRQGATQANCKTSLPSAVEMKNYSSQNPPSWYYHMASASPTTVSRETLFTLVNIQHKLYKNRLLDERRLATSTLIALKIIEMTHLLQKLIHKIPKEPAK